MSRVCYQVRTLLRMMSTSLLLVQDAYFLSIMAPVCCQFRLRTEYMSFACVSENIRSIACTCIYEYIHVHNVSVHRPANIRPLDSQASASREVSDHGCLFDWCAPK